MMKKLPYNYYKRQSIITKKRIRRAIRKKSKDDSSNVKDEFGKNWNGPVAKAPPSFSLEDESSRSSLLHFIAKIEESINNHNKVLIDFKGTNNMVVSATLLFRAKLCWISDRYPSRIIKCILPKNNKTKQVLKQIGLLDLIDYKIEVNTSDEDVIHWRYAEGKTADGEKYEEVLGHYDGRLTESLTEGLYAGFTEMATNTTQHAYPGGLSGKYTWWMFSQEKDNRLSVSVCDLGIGIPTSLPKNPREEINAIWKSVTSVFGSSPAHSQIIKAAVEHRRSATKQGHRGKGLPQLRKFLSDIPSSILTLHSNHGCYNLNKGKVVSKDYKDSVEGTIVSWSIPLDISV